MAGYSDMIGIVIKFRRGLNPALQDKIAESGNDHPDDDDPEGWFKAARRFEQNKLANAAFHGGPTRRTSPATNTSSNIRPTHFHFPSALAPPPPGGSLLQNPPKPLPPGVPMDIDTQRAKPLPLSCRRCGKLGHFAKDCDLRFDIRYMTADE